MPIEIESPEEMGYGNLRHNLTESSYRDVRLCDLGVDLNDLLLCYGDHLGDTSLRERVASQSLGIAARDVMITPGAAPALFIVATSLLERADEVVVAKPNYATNIETPRALGATVTTINLRFEDGYRLDLDRLAALVGPQTKYISLTNPHNPTGVTLTRPELNGVIKLVESRGIWLLMDETYRDLTFGEPLPLAASLSERAISVSSMSKSYGLPGIRIGWLITKNAMLQERFLAAKEQIFICGSVVDEAIADTALARREELREVIREQITLHFTIVRDWMAEQRHLEWVEPTGGVVCFPRFRSGSNVDIERFYDVLNREHGCFVGPGHWFDESRLSFRLGYAWPTTDELRSGLEAITASAEAAIR